MKALKYLTLLSVVVGAGLLAGTPAADAAHGGGEGRSGDPNWSDNPGYFTVEGTNRHSIVKAKKPVHYRICMHHGGGTTTVIHDGQTTPMHGGNCTDFVASNIDIEGTDADGSATGDFGPVETQAIICPICIVVSERASPGSPPSGDAGNDRRIIGRYRAVPGKTQAERVFAGWRRKRGGNDVT